MRWALYKACCLILKSIDFTQKRSCDDVDDDDDDDVDDDDDDGLPFRVDAGG